MNEIQTPAQLARLAYEAVLADSPSAPLILAEAHEAYRDSHSIGGQVKLDAEYTRQGLAGGRRS